MFIHYAGHLATGPSALVKPRDSFSFLTLRLLKRKMIYLKKYIFLLLDKN